MNAKVILVAIATVAMIACNSDAPPGYSNDMEQEALIRSYHRCLVVNSADGKSLEKADKQCTPPKGYDFKTARKYLENNN